MDSEDDVFGFGGSPGQEEEVEEEDQTVPCLEDPMEDTVKGVKDLLSRFHGTDEPENNMVSCGTRCCFNAGPTAKTPAEPLSC